jgi:hypothetical protein
MQLHATLRRLAPLAAAAMLLAATPLAATAAPVAAQDEHEDDDGDDAPSGNNPGTQLLCGPAQVTDPAFEDTEGSIFGYWINCLAFYDIVEGREDGTYRPRNTVTRGQMAKFIANSVEFFGEELDSSDAGFEDVDEDNVFSEYINKIANAEIAQGFGDGSYRPNGNVRRDQMARFVANAVEHIIDDELETSGETFPDVPEDSVHLEVIDKVATANIVDGRLDGTYGPREFVRRDQMAKFVAEGMGVAAETLPFLPGGDGLAQLEVVLAPLLAELSEGDAQQIEDALDALREQLGEGDGDGQEQLEAAIAELVLALQGLADAIEEGSLDEDDVASLAFAVVTALELLAEGDVDGARGVLETVISGLLPL